ncbi:MAG: AAA family ATPase [Acholeplasmatales bacterium]|jgi:putative ATPase|nr:AAA family ATPase [Acholeplasmatales bacterium]
MEPLAYLLRPLKFEDVVGHDYLIGEKGILSIALAKKKLFSFILYGNPGVGKTTIANILCAKSDMTHYFFNASTDNKQKLKDILQDTLYRDVLLVVDEIHRMNNDIQEALLPYIENGKVILVGLTTISPYHSVNIAIRSRVRIFELKDLTTTDIVKLLLKGISHYEEKITYDDGVLEEIALYSNNEARTSLNILETAILVSSNNHINKETLMVALQKKNLKLDKNADNYYALLSALQKSIRGSDVNASIHYLAKLILLEDLKIILRRLYVIAYEDIGLANSTMGMKVYAACKVCEELGLPEARIPLANIVIDMALSPKSNTALQAIDEAISDIENIDTGVIPDHALNSKIKENPKIYHYPHNDINSVNNQRYIPLKIENKRYYKAKKESSYEKALAEREELINKIKNIK